MAQEGATWVRTDPTLHCDGLTNRSRGRETAPERGGQNNVPQEAHVPVHMSGYVAERNGDYRWDLGCIRG